MLYCEQFWENSLAYIIIPKNNRKIKINCNMYTKGYGRLTKG